MREDVEADVDGWCAEDAALVVSEELEPVDEFLVVHGDLAIEDHDVSRDCRDRTGKLAEVSDLIHGVAGVSRTRAPSLSASMRHPIRLVDNPR
jgi:hypothetical protein